MLKEQYTSDMAIVFTLLHYCDWCIDIKTPESFTNVNYAALAETGISGNSARTHATELQTFMKKRGRSHDKASFGWMLVNEMRTSYLCLTL